MPHRSPASNANTTAWLRKVLICSYRDSGAVLRECLIARKGVVVSLCLITLSGGAVRADEPTFDFDIPEQRADDALILLGEQADATVLFQYDMATQHDANRLQGEYTLLEAVDILLADSGLKADFGEQGHLYISVEETESEGGGMNVKKRAGFFAALAAVFTAANAQDADESSQHQEEAPALEEIIVTGTNIRGVRNKSAPIISFDREAIALTGFARTEDLVQSLPQNFGGGASLDTGIYNSRNGTARTFPIGGTGVNLRGIGTDSTLVLLNGRRMAPAGGGSFVDISQIPLSAVERIDVLPDGASAVYGSDAVGGVVNIVLRDDFEGAETRLRYGTVTEGSKTDFQFGQVFGLDWDKGNFVISYDYSSQDELMARDRNFAQGLVEDVDLLPNAERHNILLAGSHAFGNKVEIFGTGNYTDSDVQRSIFNFFGSPALQDSISTVEVIGGTGGLAIDTSESWRLELESAFSKSSVFTESLLSDSGESLGARDTEFEVWSVDAKLDGTLMETQAGDMGVAIGFQYREESLQETFIGGVDLDRDIIAAYGEANIPLFGGSNTRPGLNEVILNAAIRYDDYSDFGSTTNPRIGPFWSPVEGLGFRTSYSTSFRAPTLIELDPTVLQSITALFPDPQAPAGLTQGLVAYGFGGPQSELGPEESTNRTVGLDYAPTFISGLIASVTYFDIDYVDRIGALSVPFFQSFSDPIAAAFIDRAPDTQFVTDLVAASAFFFDLGGFPLEDTEAFADFRSTNLASTRVRGMDASVIYVTETDSGQFTYSIDGSYVLEFENLAASGGVPEDIVDTIYNPVGLRLRGGLSYAQANWNDNLFVNYTDGYLDDQIDQGFPRNSGVPSWTTVDFNLRYETDESVGGFLRGIQLSLNVQNLLDKAPPFVTTAESSTETQIGFDPENAGPLNRFVSIQFVKMW